MFVGIRVILNDWYCKANGLWDGLVDGHWLLESLSRLKRITKMGGKEMRGEIVIYLCLGLCKYANI